MRVWGPSCAPISQFRLPLAIFLPRPRIEDFLELLATWGQPNVPGDLLPPPGVGIEDFLKLLANWGPC